MDHLIVDTCVWIDIAIDMRLAPLLDVIDRLMLQRAVRLVVPDLVVDELDRNTESVQQRTRKGYETVVREALDTAHVLPTDAEKEELRRVLGKISNALPTFHGELNSRLRRIKGIITAPGIAAQATTDDMMVVAFRRGLEKKAPFARGKNSCGDSLLLEHFDMCANALVAGDRCVFVTSNKQDFSALDDHRLPHPDIAPMFSGAGRIFSINIAEYLKGLDAASITPAVVEAAREAAERSTMVCPGGGEHDFDPNRGANLRSRYGGLTWHIFCKKCGARFDTGDSNDD